MDRDQDWKMGDPDDENVEGVELPLLSCEVSDVQEKSQSSKGNYDSPKTVASLRAGEQAVQ